jgi:uncharacterized membrane protein YqaE (UPF0057 family)
MREAIPSLILAILLPPLAVFLRFGLGRLFWIDVALTVLGWLPGAIFALVVLLRPPSPVLVEATASG